MSSPEPSGVDVEPAATSADEHTLSAFERLPNEIILQILQLVDPNSFASLVLLNTKWRRISQQADLYAYHLSRCDSYAASHSAAPGATVAEDDLPRLRRLFACEVKRNLFDAYLRPKTTTIKLISNCIGSSSAPGGEGLQFSPSPKGHHLLAYNSSRIVVLDAREPTLAVKREFKILRRPASACILDDGSLLAVLSTDMQVDLYDLTAVPPRRTRSLILDHAPRAIALSPCGSVLAAAYEGGIEVSSVGPGALPTDRRAVKCDGVDSLAFSFDGTQLLGTTTTSHIPNTVILTAPYYDPGNQMSEESNISALWTTSILFPNTSRDCSHAVLLQESSSMEATWTFTYDRSFETFRAVRIDDLRNGTTYFTGPVPTESSPVPLLPCTIPAASYQGDLVSAGFEGKDIWVYGIPEDLEAVPEGNHATPDPNVTSALSRRNSGISARSPHRAAEAKSGRVPQWQILCDKFRNTFVSGRKVGELTGVSMVKWVSGFGETPLEQRLIVAARGIMPGRLVTEEEGIDFVDGGRIAILDFDYGPVNGDETEIVIEIGTKEPEVLEEEHRDIDTEVAIVRRRTVAQRRGNRSSVISVATTTARQVDALLRPSTSRDGDLEDPLVPRPMMTARTGSHVANPEDPGDVSLEEAQEALDAPYAHANPRSGTTLRRAATAAAVNRRRNPQPAVAGPVEYRRADGRAEHPHESDADNWVPPPPPYAKDDPGDLPAFLRHSVIPGIGLASSSNYAIPPVPPLPRIPPVPPIPPLPLLPRAMPPTSRSGRPELSRLHTPTPERTSRMTWIPRTPQPRLASEGTSRNRPVSLAARQVRRPLSTPYFTQEDLPQDEEEDLYDVSPVESPSRAPSPDASDSQTVQEITPERRSLHQPSYRTQSPALENTPASSRSHHTTGNSRPTSANSRASDPSTPSPSRSVPKEGNRRADPTSVSHKLPNARTWPRIQPPSGQASSASLSGYPHSAPATGQKNEDIIAAALPPVPSLEHTAGLHSRKDSYGVPRPASSNFHYPRIHVGSRAAQTPEPQRYGGVPQGQTPAPAPSEPLIISTPKGVTGGFDIRDDSNTCESPPETVLHAPIPRHPRPASGAHLRPTVERLEAVSRASNGEPQNNDDGNSNSRPTSQLNSTSLRHHTSLNRRQSRARRGALKNIRDAKLRGWTGRRKDKNKEADGGWTDVTWASMSSAPKGQTKEKKCIVM
ncbi:hypothetical protein GGS23DRAFT_136123 [Durotheca rogersii]|uniref:uncharacterized protein n=1 Tax=Durotheca rogersii TaxID=419775 RepID=UPI002221137C|nr:uncharacterized protein GGS23DRAFT_136123 [Durotheca rogersii]KAI5861868.1 hypothetical protein GGS23DRAFT_136123 [Durotheca rogersii]